MDLEQELGSEAQRVREMEKARWRIAKELESDRMWVTGEVTMTKRQRIMGCDS